MPVEDTSQDYRLLSSFENETHTVVAFERDWDTCDKKQVPLYIDAVYPNKPYLMIIG